MTGLFLYRLIMNTPSPVGPDNRILPKLFLPPDLVMVVHRIGPDWEGYMDKKLTNIFIEALCYLKTNFIDDYRPKKG